MSFHNCQICYQDHQTSLEMESCAQTYCQVYSSSDDGDVHCQKQTTRYHQIGQECLNACCEISDLASFEFNRQNLQQCQKQNDKTTGIIVGGILGGCLFFFIFCFSCCYCIHYGCDKFCQIAKNILSLCCDKQEPKQVQNSAQKTMEQVNTLKWTFEEDEKRKILLNDNICTICLSYRSNGFLRCDHFFHDQCIFTWMKQNNGSCPKCKNSNFKMIKIYCKKCMQRYIEIDSDEFSTMQQVYQKIKGPNCPNCQSHQ